MLPKKACNERRLHLFDARLIHEVPGEPPRVVLTIFITYSREREQIFVWS